MQQYKKHAISVNEIRRYLEPGPVVLVSSLHQGQQNIMTMGWHMIAGFSPSLICCYIWKQDHSFDMIRNSRECVFNIPTADMAKTVVAIGNSTGAEIDKFAEFGLTAQPAKRVKAPIIAECHTNIECKLVDDRMVDTYSLFIFETVHARAALRPKYPKTIHYRGDGQFMLSGEPMSLRRYFKPEML